MSLEKVVGGGLGSGEFVNEDMERNGREVRIKGGGVQVNEDMERIGVR